MAPTTTEQIIDTIRQVMAQNGHEECDLSQETDILGGTSLDSLALAELIVLLEEKTKKDPFANGFVNFRTIGELARLYDK